MDSTSTDEYFVEEGEELMVALRENNSRPIIKKAHFLKPRVTTIDGSEALLRPSPSPDLKASPLRVSFSGWRLPNQKFELWAKKMTALHKPTWLKSGIYEAIQASTYRINKNPPLILSLAQRWCAETNTFVFPWGEATITLEDVHVLLGFSVSGSSVSSALEESSEMEEAIEKLEKRRNESTRQNSWILSFVGDEMEHEAFLVLWLSKFVFPDKYGHSVLRSVFPIAIRLARGERIALAPALLATLYRDLGKLRALASTRKFYVTSSLFKLVQLWIWERFENIRPKAKEIPRGEPRISRWSRLKQRVDHVGMFLLDGFDWCPYAKPLKNWEPPRFYVEEAKWVRIDKEFVSFARCMRASQLVGIGFVENYYPNRVAMQFGLDQDLPGLLTHHNTEKEAWEDYNRSLDGLKLYIPSRLATASVTARYREWWMNSVPEMLKEPTENFSESNEVDHCDDSDDDGSSKVMLLSQVFRKLGNGTKKSERLANKRRKRAREDDNESDMDCCQTQDDNITIAQRIKYKKKSGDVKNTVGERGRFEVDYNVSGLPQKPNVASHGVAEKGEDDNITIARFIKCRKLCGNVENTDGGGDGYSRLEVDYKVSDLPQNITHVAEENDETNFPDPLVASNGIMKKEEEDNTSDDEILKQRKLATDDLALKLEARMLKVEKTLAEIKQWKMRQNQPKLQFLHRLIS